jgi:hypothetical protein
MKEVDASRAEKLILDPLWRLNHLYYIIDKSGSKVVFKLNWAQKELYQSMWYCNAILKARQLGISTFVCLLFLDRCLFNSNLSAGIICHTREDSEHMFKRIKFAYDGLPEEIKTLRCANIDSARQLVFNNGSSLRVGTSMRGQTLQYLHISEFGKICAKFPEKAVEIITGSLNTLAPGQYVFIESTAEGREGHFYELCKRSEEHTSSSKDLSKLHFRFYFFPWWKEPSYRIESVENNLQSIGQETVDYFASLSSNNIELDAEQKCWYAARYVTQGEDMKREFPSTPEEAWQQSTEGAYYSKHLSKARNEERICHVPYDEALPVYTAWDLGYNDSTSIWFFQVYGKEIRLIDYVEGSGESLSHWLGVVKSKPYVYEKHLAPHDVMVHEYSSGMTRRASAAKMGMALVPVQKTELIPGIDAVRNMLNRCWFDERKCSIGIKALENYKKNWNSRAACWASDPLHNWASHGSDAFRTIATGLHYIKGQQSQIDPDRQALEPFKDSSGQYPGSFFHTGSSMPSAGGIQPEL